MKKVFCLFFTAVLLVCFLCGCSVLPEKKPSYPDESRISGSSSVKQPNNTNADETALTALQQKINHHSKGAGVAFIGYVDSESSEVDLRAYYAGSETGKA